jgi:hypothetical protein
MEGSYRAVCTCDGEYFEEDTRRYNNYVHKVPFDMSRYLTVTSRIKTLEKIYSIVSNQKHLEIYRQGDELLEIWKRLL